MTGRTDDLDLVARFAAGDEQAVRELYELYSRPVFTVAMKILGNRALAEEAVQTTMLKAWRAASSFDPSREIAPWLYTIARRVAIDLYRRERRVDVPSELADDDVAVVPMSFERMWEAWEVRTAVSQLPAEESEVVRLSHGLGMTHREIADRLNVPIGTVKSRSARAHRRLASLLRHVARTVE